MVWSGASAGGLLALSEVEVAAEPELAGYVGEGRAHHECGAGASKGALVEAGVHDVELVGDDPSEEGVAEEL